MDGILTVFFFILIIGTLVLVHELGHFIAAKLSKVEVYEFAVGFGPKLFAKSYKGTLYSINLIPLGGFVNLEGENESESKTGFRNQRLLIKVFILSAGVIMNVITSIILFNIFLLITSYKFTVPFIVDHNFSNVSSTNRAFPIAVTEVLEGSRSEGVLKPGDNIIGINGVYFSSYDEFQNLLNQNQGKETEFIFLDTNNFGISPKVINLGLKNEKGTILDVALAPIFPEGQKAYFLTYNRNVLSGVSLTYDMFSYQLKAIGKILSNAFNTGNFQELGSSVGGLPLLADQVNKAVTVGAFEMLVFIGALVSVSLAFFNILPFPALDGGHILVYSIEKLIRRKIPDGILNKINLIGFGFLILLAVIVNLKDVIQLNWIEGVFNFTKSIFGR